MHRTESTGAVSGLHVDTDVGGGITGTIIDADTMNALQEEVANVIEQCGLTLNTAAQDDTGTPPVKGRSQLYEAIFESGAIGNDAIDTIDFDKMYGAIDISSGGTATWDQDVNGLVYVNTTTGSDTTYGPSGAATQHEGVQTEYDGRGIRWANGPGDVSGFEDQYIRKAYFAADLSGTTFAETVSGSGVWVWDGTHLTDIPATGNIYSVSVRYHDTTRWLTAPCTCRPNVSGSYWSLEDVAISTGLASFPGPSFLRFYVEFDASSLSI